jgi:predicted DCC family thiol-disulfide oxidoreductase YuxK
MGNAQHHRDFLLLDGDCGLCHRLATFMDKRLAAGVDLGYRPIESKEAQAMIAALPQAMRDADTVYLLRNGRFYARSAAAVRCLLYMRWYYKMWFPVLWLIPLPLRNIGYRLIAKYRHTFFKRPTECLFRVD